MELFVANRTESENSKKVATLPIWRLVFSSPVSLAFLMHIEYCDIAVYALEYGKREYLNDILHIGFGKLIRVQQREKSVLPYECLLVCACLLFWEDTKNIHAPNESTNCS